MRNGYTKTHRNFLIIILLLAIAVLLVTFKNAIPALLYSQQPISTHNLSGLYDSVHTTGEYYGKQISSAAVEGSLLVHNVLGSTTQSKKIVIDLEHQRLFAYEGDKKIYDFPISSGIDNRTPTGTFRIWIKLRYATITGGSKRFGTYYELPNVPYMMYFTGGDITQAMGYGIHGTYWNTNIGRPSTHGDIELKTDDVEKLYYWANPELEERPSILESEQNPGTPIFIYNTSPQQ